jgi:hydroxymethylpyrimidine pyrophosphatase-like HAD family hydrolase
MRYYALATDYDGTLATHGEVDEQTLSALNRFLSSGGKLLLVTGRELSDLKQVFPHLNLFARVIAENGALPYRPATGEEELLCPSVPRAFISTLRRLGIPLSVGRVLVATVDSHCIAVREAIEESSLDLRISLNKGAVMILPAEVDKATGLRCALAELGLDARSVVGIGDAENDCEFLKVCGCAAAVANALPSVKSSVHVVTAGTHGAGVAEILDRMLAGDLLIGTGERARGLRKRD